MGSNFFPANEEEVRANRLSCLGTFLVFILFGIVFVYVVLK